jgi:alpha-1,6-mannosyltransferase
MLNRPDVQVIIALGLIVAGFLLIPLAQFHPAVSYGLAFTFTSIVFLYLARTVWTSDISSSILYLAIGIGIVLRAGFITSDPIGSDDVYRYMWDGRVQSRGISPYAYAPDAPELVPLHTQLLPASVNHPDLKTVYFPLSQWLCFICYEVSGEHICGYKLLLLFAEIATIVGLYFVMKRLAIPPRFILLYVLCPLPILQFALDAHIDGLGLPLLVAGLVLYIDGRKSLSYVLFALSASVKPVALLLLPILILRETGGLNKTRVALIPAVVIAGQFLPYLLRSNPFDGLLKFAENWTFNGVVFETLYLYSADNQKARIICAGLLLVALLILYFRRKGIIDTYYFAVLSLLILSPVVHPWYVTWLAVLLPLSRRWSGIVFAVTVSLTSYTIVNYKIYGVWLQSPAVLIFEYLPVLVILAFELRGFWKKTDASNPSFI